MVQKVVDPATDPVTYRTLVFTVTFLAGVFQVSFGLFRLGFLVDFLSHAAIVGFMGGAAIVIGLQQLKGLLGLSKFTNSTDVVSVAKAVFSALHDPVSLNLLLKVALSIGPEQLNVTDTEFNRTKLLTYAISAYVSLSRLLFIC
jgi:MFS superfamily sulfate permease-like transporter